MAEKQPNMRPGQLGRLGVGGPTQSNKTLGFYERPEKDGGNYKEGYTWRFIEPGEMFLYIETLFLELDPVTGLGWSNECFIDVILIGDELLYVGGQGHLEAL